MVLLDNKDLFFCHFPKGKEMTTLKAYKEQNCSQMFGEIQKQKLSMWLPNQKMPLFWTAEPLFKPASEIPFEEGKRI